MSDTQDTINVIMAQKKEALGVEILPQSDLLQTLILIQDKLGYVPKNSISSIAETFNVSRADVHGVITFYDDLKLQESAPPKPKHVLQVCQAEACQSMGVREIMRQLKQRYPLEGDVKIEKVYCLGNCALAPTAMIDDQPYGNISYEQINELIG